LKDKHLRMRMKQCLELATLSPCIRRKFGAMILDPDSLCVISDGYNGTPRGGTTLCKNETQCERNQKNVISGTQLEIGCIHAEQNAILNACRTGAKTLGCIIIVNGAPCLQCAKMIYHAGLKKIYILEGQYPKEAGGLKFLEDYKIDISIIHPKDLK